MVEQKIDEQFVIEKIIDFMINKKDGNWHKEKIQKANLHDHGD